MTVNFMVPGPNEFDLVLKSALDFKPHVGETFTFESSGEERTLPMLVQAASLVVRDGRVEIDVDLEFRHDQDDATYVEVLRRYGFREIPL